MNEQDKQMKLNYGKLIARCWEDDELKKRFIQSPAEVLVMFGIPVEAGVAYNVIESPKMTEYIVIPHTNALETVQLISKTMLQRVEDHPDNFLPNGLELRMVQNTEKIRHLVLPFPVELLTIKEAISLGVQFRDSVATMTDAVTSLYAVSQVTAVDIVGVATEAAAAVYVAAGAVVVLI
jgi:hypothetical protein